MRILYLADRLSVRSGADLHLLQLMQWAVEEGHTVGLAVGRVEHDVLPPEGVALYRIRGLASRTASNSRLANLEELLGAADVVHLQNVMNPVVLKRAVHTGRVIVTIQDHRVFCPGMGRSLPDGSRCLDPFESAKCDVCLADPVYRERLLRLTRERRDALKGAQLVVLSRYMADELTLVGLPGAEVIAPWVEVGPEREEAGEYFFLGGRLVAHKGIASAMDVWRVAGRPLGLRVAGEGPLEHCLEGADLLGWLSSPSLEGELRRARALLFPSFWQEPFGILAVQALAAGTPVIAVDSGGTGEWNTSGCLRLPAGDDSAMVDCIRDLAGDAAKAQRLGREGQASVAEKFSYGRIGEKLRALYGGCPTAL